MIRRIAPQDDVMTGYKYSMIRNPMLGSKKIIISVPVTYIVHPTKNNGRPLVDVRSV
jgi:hypothetical protein